METARTNGLFIGARVIYKRRDIRYVGQIIDKIERREGDTRSEYFTYVVKSQFKATHYLKRFIFILV